MNFIVATVYSSYLKFLKLITQAQQREAVVQGQSLSPYWLRYSNNRLAKFLYTVKKINGLSEKDRLLF
ncbi:MAG: hypothetical protein LBJ00_06985 [Planctomycetaceae bacterium]|jgi:hypothetical protein|nr:hypothetical protein [Planctomycetaceae bacterium]